MDIKPLVGGEKSYHFFFFRRRNENVLNEGAGGGVPEAWRREREIENAGKS